MGTLIVPNPTFFLSVDTEADDQWSVEGRRRLSLQNVHCLPRLQTLCERYAVRPTYLVTHEMATTAESSDVLVQLRETGQCEIGAHLHPWSSPPFRDEDLRGSYPCQLPDALLERQLIELTEAIENHLGVRPTSYRAGRYGLDGRILQHLESLGYLVDSSVDPLFNERRLGGPSFAGAPIIPYYPDTQEVCRPGGSAVLEIPLSAETLPRMPKFIETSYVSLSPRRRGALKRLGLRPAYLRPSYSPTSDAIALADGLVARGVPTLNMMFHSSELLPGGSPYNVEAGDVERFYGSLEQIIEHIVTDLNAIPLTYSEFGAQQRSLC